MNSDAALDLGEIAATTNPPLRHALAVPLTVHDQLVGVLSVYSAVDYHDGHRVLLERIGHEVAWSLQKQREAIPA
jgi:GAF domain-containing protein